MKRKAILIISPNDPKFLSPIAFGRAIGVCATTVRRWEAAGKIKGIRINRRVVRYPVSELQKLAAEAG